MKYGYLWFLVLLAKPGFADCQCHCIDGLPQTLCTSVDEAKTHASLCGQLTIQCPEAPVQQQIRHYNPNISGATNCRDALLYNSDTQAYSVKFKACDTKDDTTEKK